MPESFTVKMMEMIAEKTVDILGDKASMLLDDKSRTKRGAFELFHALRNLEDIFHEMSLPQHRSEDARPKMERMTELLSAVRRVETALSKIESYIEIYGSSKQREWLVEAELIDRVYGELAVDKPEFAEQFRNLASGASREVAQFIKNNFPL